MYDYILFWFSSVSVVRLLKKKKKIEKQQKRRMDLEAIKKEIEKKKSELSKRFYVSQIGLFGSYVRNEQTRTSDLDVLVDFRKPIGWDVVDLQEYLQELLGVKVDLVLKRGMVRNKKLWELVKQEVIYV